MDGAIVGILVLLSCVFLCVFFVGIFAECDKEQKTKSTTSESVSYERPYRSDEELKGCILVALHHEYILSTKEIALRLSISKQRAAYLCRSLERENYIENRYILDYEYYYRLVK